MGIPWLPIVVLDDEVLRLADTSMSQSEESMKTAHPQTRLKTQNGQIGQNKISSMGMIGLGLFQKLELDSADVDG